MSGGHFNYRENQIEDTASEIDELIAMNDSETLDRFGERIGNGYPQEIIDKFEEAVHTLRQAAEMVKRIDYLVSGDDGQDTFLRLWQTEVRKSWDAPAPCSALWMLFAARFREEYGFEPNPRDKSVREHFSWYGWGHAAHRMG